MSLSVKAYGNLNEPRPLCLSSDDESEDLLQIDSVEKPARTERKSYRPEHNDQDSLIDQKQFPFNGERKTLQPDNMTMD